MTTTVKRGAGRASYNEKTNKAAQRTPLPPKGGSVPTGVGKGSTAAILKDELAKRPARVRKSPAVVAAKPAEQKPAPVRTTKKVAAPSVELAPKAAALADHAREAGWAVEIVRDDLGRTVITASRGVEIVRTWFGLNGSMDLTDFPSYYRGGLDGVRVKLRNVSAAKRQMSAAEVDRPVKAVITNAHHRTADDEIPRKRLPFDPETATDEEVLEACNGARIQWRNSLTKLVETAFCVPNAKQIKVTDNRDPIGPGARLLHFVAVEGGFRVVRLDRLLTVMRPTQQQATAIAETLSKVGMGVRR